MMNCTAKDLTTPQTKIFTLNKTGYNVELSNSVDSIRRGIIELNIDDVFLSYPFLKAFEAVPPVGVNHLYALVKDGEQSIAFILYQYKRVKLSESINTSNVDKGLAVKLINFNMLVNGNMAVTGDHGSFFIQGLSVQQQQEIMVETTSKVKSYLRSKGIKIKSVVHKDFYDSKPEIIKNNYLEVQVEPNMIFDIKNHWTSIEDYLIDLKSKYRVRYKRTRKKLSGRVVRNLSMAELEQYKNEMSAFYKNIANDANFNLFYLPENYFLNLAKYLEHKFICKGYFNEGKLEGFITLIDNGSNLDAHFLGYDKAINSETQLYANMLYDIIDHGISNNYTDITLSRTATEIKSSAGADAYDMNVYVKATNPLINRFLKKGFAYFDTTEKWQPRSPFKG